MPEIPFHAHEVAEVRKSHPQEVANLCEYWPIVRGILLFIKSLPGVPQAVKEAIDWIIKFGDTVCPKK